MKGLYAIVDLDVLNRMGLDPLRYAQTLLDIVPAALQLRAKRAPREEVRTLLIQLRAICRGVPLVCNDDIAMALETRCDMVHLGQTDGTVADVRSVSATLGVGRSTHSVEQVTQVRDEGPTYIAYGPIFPTRSKGDPAPTTGTMDLPQVRALAQAIPLVVIGGVSHDNVEQVLPYADCVAIIGDLAILDVDARRERARSIHDRVRLA